MNDTEFKAAVEEIEARMAGELERRPITPGDNVAMLGKTASRRRSKLVFKGSKRYPQGLEIGVTEFMRFDQRLKEHRVSNHRMDLAGEDHRILDAWSTGRKYISEKEHRAAISDRSEVDFAKFLKTGKLPIGTAVDAAPLTETDRLTAALKAYDGDPEMQNSIINAHQLAQDLKNQKPLPKPKLPMKAPA